MADRACGALRQKAKSMRDHDDERKTSKSKVAIFRPTTSSVPPRPITTTWHLHAPLRRQTLRRSFPVALPLAFGLAWAYGDMAWSLLETTGVVGASLVVHLAFDRYWREEA